MKLGDKPLSEMSQEEMLSAIEELRASREALRNDAIAEKKRVDAGLPATPKEPKVKKVKEVDAFDEGMLAFLKGEKEDI